MKARWVDTPLTSSELEGLNAVAKSASVCTIYDVELQQTDCSAVTAVLARRLQANDPRLSRFYRRRFVLPQLTSVSPADRPSTDGQLPPCSRPGQSLARCRQTFRHLV